MNQKEEVNSNSIHFETRPFLLITGMHRSGTSFLARALNLAGVYLGNLNSITSHDLRSKEDNLRGNWEKWYPPDSFEKTC